MDRRQTTLIAGAAAIALAVGVTLAVTAGSSTSSAATTAPTGAGDTVSVSGRGTVQGKPDTLVAQLRVHVREPAVQTALNAVAADADKVIAKLRGQHVQSADIRTTDVSLNPDYDTHGNLLGYAASESLTVHIHPLTHVGSVLTAASSAAGNAVSINGLSFDIADNKSLLAAARAEAFGNAKAAAAQYAQLGGTSLGRVVSIRSVVHNASPIYHGPVADTAGSVAYARALPIQPGRQNVSVTVKVIWSLTG